MNYITEDGVEVAEGDRVYNYYDMKPGVIGRPSGSTDGWFHFKPDNGGQYTILNGARICTIEYAKGRGFPDA